MKSLTLSQFILEKIQSKKEFYNSIYDRYLLAMDLLVEYKKNIYTTNHIDNDKPDTSLITPYLNLDNIYITKDIDSEHYKIQFPLDINCDDSLDCMDTKCANSNYSYTYKGDIYQDIDIADCNIYDSESADSDEEDFTDDDGDFGMSKTSDEQLVNEFDKSAIYTLGVIMFNICFCCHPFYGRQYYSKLDILVNKNTAKEFFLQHDGKEFIFDVGSNRFVSSAKPYSNMDFTYDDSYVLWQNSSEGQRSFWTNCFSENIDSFEDFCDLWIKNYSLKKSYSYTPCGKIIRTYFLDESYQLVVTSSLIGIGSVRCDLINIPDCYCAGCKRESYESTFRTDRVMIDNGDKIKALVIYPGQIIRCKDIFDDGSDEILFKVIYKEHGHKGIKMQHFRLMSDRYPVSYTVDTDKDVIKKNASINTDIPLVIKLKIFISKTTIRIL